MAKRADKAVIQGITGGALRTLPNTLAFYTGPSAYDGAPIVAAMSGLWNPSENSKTGPVVQTWFFRSDMNPFGASVHCLDGSVCSACPLRRSLTVPCPTCGRPIRPQAFRCKCGNRVYRCYVNTGKAATNTWDAAMAHRAITLEQSVTIARAIRPRVLRLGAYGNCSAVPRVALEPWLRGFAGYSFLGYISDWAKPENDWLKDYCMASVGRDEGARQLAIELGWKYFAIGSANERPKRGEVRCSNNVDKSIQCIDCLKCGGLSSKGKANIRVIEH